MRGNIKNPGFARLFKIEQFLSPNSCRCQITCKVGNKLKIKDTNSIVKHQDKYLKGMTSRYSIDTLEKIKEICIRIL